MVSALALLVSGVTFAVPAGVYVVNTKDASVSLVDLANQRLLTMEWKRSVAELFWLQTKAVLMWTW